MSKVKAAKVGYGKGDVKRQAVNMAVRRADGSIEQRGIWAYAHRNPILHYGMNAWIKVKVAYYWIKDWRAGRHAWQKRGTA